MKRLFKFKYPKFMLLVILIIVSYLIFSNHQARTYLAGFGNYGYLSILIAGMLFPLGFLAPFSAGFFIISNPENIFFATLIASIGAVLADLLIFSVIRMSFAKEFRRLENTKIMREISELFEKDLGHRIKVYFLYAVIGFLLASPLPDELGVIMLAGLTKIHAGKLAVFSFILHFLGILALFAI